MSEPITLEYAFKLCKWTLEEIKDCPISKEEMMEKAEKTLKTINDLYD
jgi:hypothetical protein